MREHDVPLTNRRLVTMEATLKPHSAKHANIHQQTGRSHPTKSCKLAVSSQASECSQANSLNDLLVKSAHFVVSLLHTESLKP